jgi:hypothetical protein
VGKKTTACLAAGGWDTPRAFVLWAQQRDPREIRALLRGLGVRRIPTLLRYVVRST